MWSPRGQRRFSSQLRRADEREAEAVRLCRGGALHAVREVGDLEDGRLAKMGGGCVCGVCV